MLKSKQIGILILVIFIVFITFGVGIYLISNNQEKFDIDKVRNSNDFIYYYLYDKDDSEKVTGVRVMGLTISSRGWFEEVTIPETIDGYKVTEIGCATQNQIYLVDRKFGNAPGHANFNSEKILKLHVPKSAKINKVGGKSPFEGIVNGEIIYYDVVASV